MAAHLLALLLVTAAGAGLPPSNEGVSARMGERLPEQDLRLTRVRTEEEGNRFVPPSTRAAWLRRAGELRQQILVATGLWPMLPKTALRPQVYGRLERDGYTIEKVVLRTLPGFYLTGNLYRPAGSSAHDGKVPGVLCPHGHWPRGRFEADVQARGAGLARLGCVAFLYDMVGFGDGKPFGHTLRDARMERLGVSLTGLQLWNSLRALDYLRSLPDVDPDRLACTGESGGGTQTFLLSAVADRVRLTAPVCMVSASYQGGCECENCPSLRIDTDNVEIAAAAAPRPQFLVGATGDWTRAILEVGFPQLQETYRLLEAANHVGAVRFQAEHNYNQQSREAVYGWIARWLLGSGDGSPIHERPCQPETEATLSCYDAQHSRPADELDAPALKVTLARLIEQQTEALAPRSLHQWRRARQVIRIGLQHRLAVRVPPASELLAEAGPEGRLFLGRRGAGDRIPAHLWPATDRRSRTATLVVSSDGLGSSATSEDDILVRRLRKAGQSVLAIDVLGVGEHAATLTPGGGYFTTYNRTLMAERVQDVLTALAFLRSQPGVRHVNLVGEGSLGPACLLARAVDPRVNRAAIDADAFEYALDRDEPADRVLPGILRWGGLKAAAALAAPGPLLLHHTAGALDLAWAQLAYELEGRADAFRTNPQRVSDDEVIRWLTA